MSTPKPEKSLRSQTRSITERLTSLERNLFQFVPGVEAKIGDSDRRLADLEEKIEALIELAGASDVEQVINRRRVEQARASAAIEKQRLDDGVKEGYILPTEKVGEKSILVGTITKDGEVVEPGRFQMTMVKVKPQFKEKLLNQAAGVVVDIENGGKFELTEIYEVDTAKALEIFKQKQEEAQKAAAEAAQAETQEEAAAESSSSEQAAAPAPEAAAEEAQPQVEG